jgi:plastocyanin
MRLNRILVAGSFVVLLGAVGTTIRAQVGSESDPQYGGGAAPGSASTANNAPITCPLSSSNQAASANCVTVVIPPNAAGQGPAAFGVNPLNVGLGVTIIWYNQDTTDHTVTANDGSFDSGPIPPGQYYSRTFNNPGNVPYYCTIHGQQSMSGAVNVSNNMSTPLPCSQATCAGGAPPVYVVPIYVLPRPIVTPTRSPSVRPSVSPSPSHSPSPSPSPSVSPSPSPSPRPSTSPSSAPSPGPSSSPGSTPSSGPSTTSTTNPEPAPSFTIPPFNFPNIPFPFLNR